MIDLKKAQEQLTKYEALQGYLLGYVYDRIHGKSAFDNAAYIGKIPNKGPDEFISDMKNILLENPFPWEAIKRVANVSAIKSEETCKEWLLKMIEIIEENRPPEFQVKK